MPEVMSHISGELSAWLLLSLDTGRRHSLDRPSLHGNPEDLGFLSFSGLGFNSRSDIHLNRWINIAPGILSLHFSQAPHPLRELLDVCVGEQIRAVILSARVAGLSLGWETECSSRDVPAQGHHLPLSCLQQ